VSTSATPHTTVDVCVCVYVRARVDTTMERRFQVLITDSYSKHVQ